MQTSNTAASTATGSSNGLQPYGIESKIISQQEMGISRCFRFPPLSAQRPMWQQVEDLNSSRFEITEDLASFGVLDLFN